jgi:hypothetical protein
MLGLTPPVTAGGTDLIADHILVWVNMKNVEIINDKCGGTLSYLQFTIHGSNEYMVISNAHLFVVATTICV